MAFTKLLWRKSVTCRGHCGFSNSNDDADKDGGPEEYFTVIYLRKNIYKQKRDQNSQETIVILLIFFIICNILIVQTRKKTEIIQLYI